MSAEDREYLEHRIAEAEAKQRKVERAKRKEQRKQFWTDFKKFISKGNIIDLAVAVVVGTAFNSMVNGIVKFIITPIISLLTGGINMTEWKWVLKEGVPATDTTPAIAEIAVEWGSLIQAIINFLIIAMFVFLALRFITNMNKKTHILQTRLHREAEAKKKAEEEAKKKAEAVAAAKLEAEKAALAEREAEYYRNVREQTELLRTIAQKLQQTQGNN